MKYFKCLILICLVFCYSCVYESAPKMVLVEGSQNIKSFWISTHETTQAEWVELMGTNPAKFKKTSNPIENVSWYDCIEYCNLKSKKEGLEPYYVVDKYKKDTFNTNPLDDVRWTVTRNVNANGYRLPTKEEWTYAASGGKLSKKLKYSGSNNIQDVAWYWQNSGDKFLRGFWNWKMLESNHNSTHEVGSKKPNELGIFDMSGNVREWCWDWFLVEGIKSPISRVWMGGGWIGADFCCEVNYIGDHQPNGIGPDHGFRVCKNAN